MIERERNLDHLLTSVDAVVAIAITLLVLPLAEVGAEVRGVPVADLVREHMLDIVGFLLRANDAPADRPCRAAHATRAHSMCGPSCSRA